MEQLELPFDTGKKEHSDHPIALKPPPLKALEAACLMRLAEMIKNDTSKEPHNLEAVLIAARVMARKALHIWMARHAQTEVNHTPNQPNMANSPATTSGSNDEAV